MAKKVALLQGNQACAAGATARTGRLNELVENGDEFLGRDARAIVPDDDPGTVEFGKDFKNKQRIYIKPDDESVKPVEYLIPRGKSLAVLALDIDRFAEAHWRAARHRRHRRGEAFLSIQG